MTPLRQAFSDLDNALPESLFDYDLDQRTVDAVWEEIDKAEKLIKDVKDCLEHIINKEEWKTLQEGSSADIILSEINTQYYP